MFGEMIKYNALRSSVSEIMPQNQPNRFGNKAQRDAFRSNLVRRNTQRHELLTEILDKERKHWQKRPELPGKPHVGVAGIRSMQAKELSHDHERAIEIWRNLRERRLKFEEIWHEFEMQLGHGSANVIRGLLELSYNPANQLPMNFKDGLQKVFGLSKMARHVTHSWETNRALLAKNPAKFREQMEYAFDGNVAKHRGAILAEMNDPRKPFDPELVKYVKEHLGK